MDLPIRSIPGMEGFLRQRDLPSMFRAHDLNYSAFKMVVTETHQTVRAHALILNTFEDLEGSTLSQIRTRFQRSTQLDHYMHTSGSKPNWKQLPPYWLLQTAYGKRTGAASSG